MQRTTSNQGVGRCHRIHVREALAGRPTNGGLRDREAGLVAALLTAAYADALMVVVVGCFAVALAVIARGVAEAARRRRWVGSTAHRRRLR
jgi:hypothetical protein